MDHHVHEGRIVHIDRDHLYLSVPHPYHAPAPGTHGTHGTHTPHRSYTYRNVVLPLVLYNLLVVTLLS
ncbi:hypothetical protein [Paenibacillus sp. 8b26]|uniref:hypothetical protein n=1 Tax=Paenibacillus sp. 8b26 TaxID=3424133 RepID=UPI003D64E8AD